MNKKLLGSLVRYERRKKNISPERLANGICSVSAIKRLERGERLPDYFVLEKIMERLGHSLNKMEFLYDENVYEVLYLREIIEWYLEEEQYDALEKALAYYESRREAKEALHQQYICKMKAVLLSERDGKHEEAVLLFEKALEQSVPQFDRKHLEEYLLGEEEIVLFLLWMQEMTKLEQIEIDGKRILRYIERICTDEEVLANVYSKAVWVFGSLAIKQDNHYEAIWYTLQGEKILVENSLLMHLPQFLDRILSLTEKRDDKAYREWKKQRDALKRLYEAYGKRWETNSIALWKSFRQKEIYLISELFRQERTVMNQSQEKMADILALDQKTISRIETGKYRPKAGTFQKIKEYLQINREICSTRIIVDDFELLEMERNVARLSYYRKTKEAENLYQILKGELSMDWLRNRQYAAYMDIIFASQLGRMTFEEAIQPSIDAFRITRGGIPLEKIDRIVLSRTEAIILNYVAICYDKTGRKEEAIGLLKKIVGGYDNSRVDNKYHYVALSLVYMHLAFDCEECDQLEEAMTWADRAIRFEFQCNRGSDLGFLLEQRQYTIDRMAGRNTASKHIYWQAYQLLKLMKKEYQMKGLRRVYKKWYGEEVE